MLEYHDCFCENIRWSQSTATYSTPLAVWNQKSEIVEIRRHIRDVWWISTLKHTVQISMTILVISAYITFSSQIETQQTDLTE
jgi:hypothetical protein